MLQFPLHHPLIVTITNTVTYSSISSRQFSPIYENIEPRHLEPFATKANVPLTLAYDTTTDKPLFDRTRAARE